MTRFKIIGFWSIILFFIWSIYIGFSCTSGSLVKKDIYADCIDSLSIYKQTIFELQQKIDEDSVLLLKKVDSINKIIVENKNLKDSIISLNKKPLMTEELFLQTYRYKRLKYYYDICQRNSSQWQFYRGWSTRVFKGEED